MRQDYAQAVSWYRKAADQGNANAQLNLGVFYAEGRWVIKSCVIAYALYNVSATNNQLSDNTATKYRKDIASGMSNQEITVAQRLTAAMMKPKNLLMSIDHYESHPMEGATGHSCPISYTFGPM